MAIEHSPNEPCAPMGSEQEAKSFLSFITGVTLSKFQYHPLEATNNSLTSTSNTLAIS